VVNKGSEPTRSAPARSWTSVASLGRHYRGVAASGENHAHRTADEIGRQFRQSIESSLRPNIFDADVAVLDIASFVQSLAERGNLVAQHSRRPAAEKPDHRHRRLLRARRERPRRRRATEQRDELAPPCMSGKEHCEG
jgi:hypothetical protein